MPAGWVYDNVLELVAEKLKDNDPELGTLLRQGQTATLGHCDLRNLDRNQFGNLTEAAEAAYAEVAKRGPKAFANPSYYAGFLKQFRGLLSLLRADPRLR